MGNEQGRLWSDKTWHDDLVPEGIQTKRGIKKDLTYRIKISPLFGHLKGPIDFNRMAEFVGNKYSDFKVSVALIKSLGEYHKKSPEEVNFLDLIEMHKSIKNIFGNEMDYKDLTKWKKANGLSFFGPAQYELMEKYIG